MRVVQDMYEGSVRVCGRSDRWSNRGDVIALSLSPPFFDVMMNRLTDELRQESLWAMTL